MQTLIKQTTLGFKRELIRNPSFLFFSLVMPAGFYLLFTKIMTNESATEQSHFAVAYMNSMIVFSLLLGMIFSFASLLGEDHRQNLLTLMAITPVNPLTYYAALVIVMSSLNVLVVLVIEVLAVVMNHVDLTYSSLLVTAGWAVVGGIPLMLIGATIAQSTRPATISALCNLVVFPMAIVSGLWWPLSLLPDWMQQFGKLMPTYAVSQLLNSATGQATFSWRWVMMLASWVVVISITLGLILKWHQKRS
ncbi:ABC transporter permease [Furfurilactobacillus curtus]|uniref:Multidrug ABC transporter permease n=1 Tax=Furfurilactobacillus curtus TaxID=1746200 RepID=A0ABQ5JTQ9_9LACO